MKPLVSVLVTTYNSADTIERLLNSIFAQNGVGEIFELEVLVADDCSTDNTVEVLKQFPVWRMSNEQNSGGPNLGRNKLLKLAKGDYITIADHDDEWYPHKIVTYLRYVQQATILSSGYTVFNEQNNTEHSIVKQAPNGIKLYKQNETFVELLKKNYNYQTTYLGTLFFPKSLKHIVFETKYGKADYDYQIRLFEGQTSLEICTPLYKRYVIGSNLSLNETYRNQDVEVTLKALDYYKNNYPKEVALGKQRTYGTLARFYYLIGNMPKARVHFKQADKNWKTLLYYCTTYGGSQLVKKYFKVFG